MVQKEASCESYDSVKNARPNKERDRRKDCCRSFRTRPPPVVRARWRACLLALLIVMVLTPSQSRAQAAAPARPSVLAAGALPGAFRFDGSGYGHGIGMSQYGAYGMALRGYSSSGIIAHYYRGDCAVYPDTRDQFYSGWAHEGGPAGARWVAAVNGTGSLAVRYGGRVVPAFYSSSSGGMTQSNAVWGGAPLPYLPVQPDPWDCAGDQAGDCRNSNWRWLVQRPAATVSEALGPLGLGAVTGIEVTWHDGSGRVRGVRVSGTRGAAAVTGATLQRLLRLKSTRFTVMPVG